MSRGVGDYVPSLLAVDLSCYLNVEPAEALRMIRDGEIDDVCAATADGCWHRHGGTARGYLMIARQIQKAA